MVKVNVSNQLKESTMKSKISIIVLSLMAMTFTFVLGTASSKAAGDVDNVLLRCLSSLPVLGHPEVLALVNVANNQIRLINNYNSIVSCAKQAQNQ